MWNMEPALLIFWNTKTFLVLQDIQIRGVNRDERNLKMAIQYPNSKHFLTYRHSLRVILHDICWFIRASNEISHVKLILQKISAKLVICVYLLLSQSYASILYLQLPSNFKMSLRGKEVEHHDIGKDMKMAQEITYKPMHIAEGSPNDSNVISSRSLPLYCLFPFLFFCLWLPAYV